MNNFNTMTKAEKIAYDFLHKEVGHVFDEDNLDCFDERDDEYLNSLSDEFI